MLIRRILLILITISFIAFLIFGVIQRINSRLEPPRLLVTAATHAISQIENPESLVTALNVETDKCPNTITGAYQDDSTGCPTQFTPDTGMTFDNNLHQAWYSRFWTGSCAGVNAFCLPGVAWSETVETLVSRFSDEEQGYIRNRLWALGRAVGYDWAKDNSDGQITTGDLQAWGSQLDNTEELLQVISKIENDVCTRLGNNILEGDYSTAEACDQ